MFRSNSAIASMIVNIALPSEIAKIRFCLRPALQRGLKGRGDYCRV
jgi:hypothetical protein